MKNRELLRRAKRLRRRQTPAEAILWNALRRRQLLGFKFRRQHIIECYIVDFVCLSAQLIVEVDGSSHRGKERRDEQRARFLRARGFEILRFSNEEVLKNGDAVLEAIAEVLQRLG